MEREGCDRFGSYVLTGNEQGSIAAQMLMEKKKKRLLQVLSRLVLTLSAPSPTCLLSAANRIYSDACCWQVREQERALAKDRCRRYAERLRKQRNQLCTELMRRCMVPAVCLCNRHLLDAAHGQHSKCPENL